MLFMEDTEDTMGHKDFFPFRWVEPLGWLQASLHSPEPKVSFKDPRFFRLKDT